MKKLVSFILLICAVLSLMTSCGEEEKEVNISEIDENKSALVDGIKESLVSSIDIDRLQKAVDEKKEEEEAKIGYKLCKLIDEWYALELPAEYANSKILADSAEIEPLRSNEYEREGRTIYVYCFKWNVDETDLILDYDTDEISLEVNAEMSDINMSNEVVYQNHPFSIEDNVYNITSSRVEYEQDKGVFCKVVIYEQIKGEKPLKKYVQDSLKLVDENGAEIVIDGSIVTIEDTVDGYFCVKYVKETGYTEEDVDMLVKGQLSYVRNDITYTWHI